MNRFIILFAIAIVVVLTPGCGSTEKKVSTIPWNKPQKWENKAMTAGPSVGY